LQSPRRSNQRLEIGLLGEFSFRCAGRPVDIPGGKIRGLVAFLACDRRRFALREKLADLLWSNSSDQRARQSLRQVLSTLRQTLGSESVIVEQDRICLSQTVSCDVPRFLSLIEAGDTESMRKAVALYRGDLLSGFSIAAEPFMDWLAAERARLRDLALGALEGLMEKALNDAAPTDLLEYAKTALAIDPYREEAHRQLIRAFALVGRRNEAILHYRQLERTLKDELGVQPEAATVAVMETAQSGKMTLSSTLVPTHTDGAEKPRDDAISRPRLAGSHAAVTDKPSIVVLPFDSLSVDARTSRLAIGITEDIITDLSRFRGLEVIAQNSAIVSKAKSAEVQEIGRDLNVTYVLKGAIQRQGGQIRITAQLIDAMTAKTIWSDRWDRPAKDVFAIQTEVAERIAATLGGMGGSAIITTTEIQRTRRRPPKDLTAYDYYLLANEGRTLFTDDAVAAGLHAADKAIALEPTLGRAYVARSWLNYLKVHHGGDFETAMQAMEVDAKKAVALDPYDAEAHVTLAFYLSGRGRFDDADSHIQTALQANPTNAQVLVVSAAVLAWGGKPELGASLADRVRRLDPWMTSENLNCLKDAYFFARRFEDAISVMSSVPVEARGRGTRVILTLSYALLGREAETARARTDLLEKYPRIAAELLMNQDWLCARQDEEELLLAGFRAADLPLYASDTDLAGIENPLRLTRCQASSVES